MSNIHVNCSVLWFTEASEAILCYTSKCSRISSADVCYSQHFSFLHHAHQYFLGSYAPLWSKRRLALLDPMLCRLFSIFFSAKLSTIILTAVSKK